MLRAAGRTLGQWRAMVGRAVAALANRSVSADEYGQPDPDRIIAWTSPTGRRDVTHPWNHLE